MAIMIDETGIVGFEVCGGEFLDRGADCFLHVLVEGKRGHCQW